MHTKKFVGKPPPPKKKIIIIIEKMQVGRSGSFKDDNVTREQTRRLVLS